MKASLMGEPFRLSMRAAAVLVDAEAKVRVEASRTDGHLLIEAGHGGIYVRQTIDADVEEDGVFVINCQHVTPLRIQDDDVLRLEAEDKSLSFKSGKFKGSVSVDPDSDDIENQRPLKEFEANVALPADVFKDAVAKVAFPSALPNAEHGVRIQATDHLVISSTDQYRAAVYKEQLAIPQEDFDVLINPAFLNTVLGRIQDVEVRLGARKGTLKIETDDFVVYHPAIQSDPEDIEEWIATGIDYDSRRCLARTQVEDLVKCIQEASSISMGSSFETRLDCLVKKNKLVVRVTAPHGKAQSSLTLDGSDASKFVTRLSSRYTLEMLNLIKVGDLELGFWDDFVLMRAFSGKYACLMPTVVE